MNSALEASVIALDVDLDLSAAVALKEQLVGAVGQQAEILIDASSVERLTTPCAQILVAAARSLAEQGRGLVVKSPSEPFVSAFSDLGLDQAMQQWVTFK